tara:strand:+ start:675 stop:1253 length:579 start_codon:yes stop_codon:yes gene_type:complete
MSQSRHDEVTRILAGLGSGESSLEELLPVVYAELRSAADRLMRSERDNHTLQPTALVHEVFVRLADGNAALGQNRGHFLGIAARAMRNLLVDHARRRKTEKRAGRDQQVTLTGVADDAVALDVELLDLHEAMEGLAALDERQARIVELSFFAGMTGDEIAAELGLHRNTVVRELRMGRAWLRSALEDGGAKP